MYLTLSIAFQAQAARVNVLLHMALRIVNIYISVCTSASLKKKGLGECRHRDTVCIPSLTQVRVGPCDSSHYHHHERLFEAVTCRRNGLFLASKFVVLPTSHGRFH